MISPGLATSLAAGLALLYLGLFAGKSLLALRARHREAAAASRSAASATPAPAGPSPRAETIAEPGAGVAVLQAILSGDPRLATVLEGNLQELPAARFLWLVDADDTVAQAVCADLACRNSPKGGREGAAPRRLDCLISPPAAEGHNPKVHKLRLAEPAVSEPVLLVLDDDTRMPSATLRELLDALAAAEVATSLPGYLDDGRWPSRLLAQFVNNNAALTYLPLLAFCPPLSVNGMAYAVRRDFLAAMGGFTPLLGFLTDDLALAARARAAGGRISQVSLPHWVETTVRDRSHYTDLMHRWFLFALLLLRRQAPRIRALIALLDALPPLLLAALLATFAAGPGAGAAAVVLATLALRALGLVTLQRTFYGRSLHAPIASVVSELLQPLHLLHALCRRQIVWRRRRYLVHNERHFTSL